MNDLNYRITLDMHSVLSQVSIPVPQYDTARRLSISLSEDGKPYLIEDGCRAAFTAIKADGKCILNDCIIEGNTTIRYDFTLQTTAAVGKMDVQIKLYDAEGSVITSPRITLVVYKGTVCYEHLSEDEKNTLEGMLVAEAARAAAEDARAAAELGRVQAEQGRVTADGERQEATDEAVEEANEAAERANEIAETLEKHYEEGDFELGLPIVTAADNGKMLRVVDGEWKKDTIPTSYVDTADGTATSDDILAGESAYVNGERVEGNIETYEDGERVSVLTASEIGALIQNEIRKLLRRESMIISDVEPEIGPIIWFDTATGAWDGSLLLMLGGEEDEALTQVTLDVAGSGYPVLNADFSEAPNNNYIEIL